MTRTPAALAAIAITLATAHAASAAGTPVPSGATVNGPGLAPVVSATPTPLATIGDAISITRPAGSAPRASLGSSFPRASDRDSATSPPAQTILLPRTGSPVDASVAAGVALALLGISLRRRGRA